MYFKLDKALKIVEISQAQICDHCMGLKFSKEIEDPVNPLRGKKMRDMVLQSGIVIDNESK